MKKTVTIVTIPLVYYHNKLYWCVHHEHTGKVREHLLTHPEGGKQVQFSFDQALNSFEGDLLILADDKFNFEKNTGRAIPSDDQVKNFTKIYSLPPTWVEKINSSKVKYQMVIPPMSLSCTGYTFSEKLLLKEAMQQHDLQGECTKEWTFLLEYFKKNEYEKVHAYIPKVCFSGVCQGSLYSKDSGIFEKPIIIDFTEKDSIFCSKTF